MEIFSPLITSKNIGYVVPIKITDKKYIINQLLIKIDVSLLKKENETEFKEFEENEIEYCATSIIAACYNCLRCRRI